MNYYKNKIKIVHFKYEPETGRFTAPDPLWTSYLGWTPYHYSQNDPINWQDGNGYLRLASKGEIAPLGEVQPNIMEDYSVFAKDIQYNMLNFVKDNGLDVAFAKELSISVNTFNKGLEWGKGSKVYSQQLDRSFGWNHNGKISVSKAWLIQGQKDFGSRIFNLINALHEYVHNFDGNLDKGHKIISKVFRNLFDVDENNPFEIMDAASDGRIKFFDYSNSDKIPGDGNPNYLPGK